MNIQMLALTIFAIVKLRQSVEAALLNVFLPVLLLVPSVYVLTVPHIPPISPTGAVLIPIAIWAVITRGHEWRFQRADLWVLLFVLAAGYSDFINLGFTTALFNFPSICVPVVAYFMGKVLIEQGGIREKFAQRLVVLLSIVGVVSVSEFALKHNLFLGIANRFLWSDSYWGDALRGRFVRVKGPFSGAEETGIMFLMGFFIALWLCFLNRTRQSASEPKYFGLRRSTVCICGILLGLYMTLSRGPWLGTAAGFLIAGIGLVKNKRLAMAVALILGTAGAIAAHNKASQYAKVDVENASEAQSSAEYRTHLLDIYKPVAESGGLFGWSATAYPRDRTYGSIDNEYLFLWVIQGKVGLSLFILIVLEGGFGIVRAIRRSRQRVDICFYYCLGGIFAGLMVVLITVFLTAQGYVLFFMFIGWSQSLREQYGEVEVLPQGPPPRFAFRRVFA
jgi:hypothetical protein